MIKLLPKKRLGRQKIEGALRSNQEAMRRLWAVLPDVRRDGF
ncbi:MAG: hypothetical protein AAGA92_05680 [Planctomycetota bacterium]